MTESTVLRGEYRDVARRLADRIVTEPVERRAMMLTQAIMFAKWEFSGDPAFRLSAFRAELEETLRRRVEEPSCHWG